jgi:hypothetical protein
MNRSLKRITQTLEQLGKPAPAPARAVQPVTPVPSAAPAAPSPAAPKASVSFDLPRRTDPGSTARATATPKSLANLQVPCFSGAATGPNGLAKSLVAGVAPVVADRSADRAAEPLAESPAPVAPFAVVPDADAAALNLPKFKLPSFANHRNGANPDLAANLLQDMLASVSAWRAELNQAVRQIQDLYREGPIVDGWLECTTRPQASAASQASTDRLLDSVDASDQPEDVLAEEAGPIGLDQATDQTLEQALGQTATYQLCGLNADGRSWSCPCPPEQVPSVSLAIVRHQRLRHLLSRKQDLENRLGTLAESLVKLHGQLL